MALQKTFTLKKFRVLVFFISVIILPNTGTVSAQNQESAEEIKPNRLSIGIMGGVSRGHLDVGSAFQSGTNSNFDFQEQLNSTLGFNLRYAATDEIALQSNIMLGKFSLLSDYFRQEALSFINNYITTSITTQLNLLRIIGVNAENFNFYTSFGGGLMFNDVSIETDNPEIASRGITPSDHPFASFFTTFGAGMRFNLNYRLDSFAQYDFTSSHRDIVDGNFIGELLALNGSAETANAWSTVSVGLQYKFGKSSRDADWPLVEAATARPVTPATTPERDVFEELEELLARQADFYKNEIEELTERVETLEGELAEERSRNQEEEQEKEDPYAAVLREMQERIDSLEKSLAEERRLNEPPSGEQGEIAEQTEHAQTPEEELPPIKAVQRVRLQPEMMGLSSLEIPEPEVIQLVPERIEMEDLAQALESLIIEPELDTPEEEIIEEEQHEFIAETLPETDEIEEVETEVKLKAEVEEITETEEEIEPEVVVEEKTEIEEEIKEELAVTDTETEFGDEHREIRLLADSLKIIEALNELETTQEDTAKVVRDVPEAHITEPKLEEIETEVEKTEPTPIDDEGDEEVLAEAVDTLPEIADTEEIEVDDSSEEDSELIVERERPVAQEIEQDTKPVKAESPQQDIDSDQIDEEEVLAHQMDQTPEQADSDDVTEDTQDDSSTNWALYTIIAGIVAGAIFFATKLFKAD